ncbi:hypothetical protein [Baekduia soli]|uniref:hypothetical protein n=1 Tax=Baekduia soli TaxID=496014 RepID=UPI001651FBC0|nr:hypothetical protein [Baekduia soli]
MTRKSITTNPPIVACDVCGRTLLRGESADVFLSGGSRRNVCDLCTGRAVHEGWIREGLDDIVSRGRDQRRRGGSLLSRLRSGRRGDGAPDAPAVREPGGRWPAPGAGRHDAPDEPPPLPEPEPEPLRAPPTPAHHHEPADHTLYESRSVRGVPTNAELKVARALELFNGSQQIRTVAGVARSLGAPIVSARPSRTEGSVVTIVVAWELSWYRFEVDLGNEAAGVRVTTQGSELSELDEIEQTANAAADEQGRLHPAASLA